MRRACVLLSSNVFLTEVGTDSAIIVSARENSNTEIIGQSAIDKLIHHQHQFIELKLNSSYIIDIDLWTQVLEKTEEKSLMDKQKYSDYRCWSEFAAIDGYAIERQVSDFQL